MHLSTDVYIRNRRTTSVQRCMDVVITFDVVLTYIQRRSNVVCQLRNNNILHGPTKKMKLTELIAYLTRWDYNIYKFEPHCLILPNYL